MKEIRRCLPTKVHDEALGSLRVPVLKDTVDGLLLQIENAVQDSEAISRLVREEQADVVCLQETKLKDSDVEACERILRPVLPGFHMYWNTSIARKGYSGTAIFSRCVTLLHTHHAFYKQAVTEQSI